MQTVLRVQGIRQFPNPVLVLGVFDGVHLGHQRILKSAVKKARAINGTSILLTFWPHPQKQQSLYSLEHRLQLMQDLGFQVCIVIRFTKAFSRMSAESFVEKIIYRKIKPSYVYIGRNFSFGKNASGDWRLLKELSLFYRFKLKVFDVLKIRGKVISSTLIRGLVRHGRLSAAEKLLGRRVSVMGTVIRGASLARKIGVPTANINPHHEVLPPSGVYIVAVFFENNKYAGVCSIGTKPTLTQSSLQHVEVHIFNFRRQIYSKVLKIDFIKKIRKQKKFSSLTALSSQIRKDLIFARKYLLSP